MDLRVVLAVVVLAFITVGSALECWHCGSPESSHMCLKRKFVRECKAWEDRCYKMSVDTTYEGKRLQRYTRGCGTDKQCFEKSMDDCKAGDKKDHSLPCEVYCCGGDQCNGATSPTISGVVACAVLITYTVLALLF